MFGKILLWWCMQENHVLPSVKFLVQWLFWELIITCFSLTCLVSFFPSCGLIFHFPNFELFLTNFAFSKRKLCNGENFRIKDFDEFWCYWGSWVRIIGFKKCMYACMYIFVWAWGEEILHETPTEWVVSRLLPTKTPPCIIPTGSPFQYYFGGACSNPGGSLFGSCISWPISLFFSFLSRFLLWSWLPSW